MDIVVLSQLPMMFEMLSWQNFVFGLLVLVLKEAAVSSRVGMVNFAMQKTRVVENVGSAQVSLVRTGGSSGVLKVSYMTQGLTAVANYDYRPVTGNVFFEPGQKFATLRIPIIDDNVEEPTEQFLLLLSGDTVTQGFQTVQILDDDVYSPWTQWTGVCSVTCGNGVAHQTRTRKCNSSFSCDLPLEESRLTTCRSGGCRDSCWSDWGAWIRVGSCKSKCFQVWICTRRCLCSNCTGSYQSMKRTRCYTGRCLRSVVAHLPLSPVQTVLDTAGSLLIYDD